MMHRVTAVALVVALSLLGTPLPAQAAGEEAPAPRVLTVHGQPLSHLLDTAPTARPRLPLPWSLEKGLPTPGKSATTTLTAQAGEQQDEEERGMSTGAKIAISAGVAVAAVLLIVVCAGLYSDSEGC